MPSCKKTSSGRRSRKIRRTYGTRGGCSELVLWVVQVKGDCRGFSIPAKTNHTVGGTLRAGLSIARQQPEFSYLDDLSPDGGDGQMKGSAAGWRPLLVDRFAGEGPPFRIAA